MNKNAAETTVTQALMTQTILLQSKAQTSDEDLVALFKAVHALKEHIPCLLAVSAGENQSSRHRGFTHGIFLHFADETHLRDAMQQSVYIHLFEKVQQLSEAVVILELPETLTFPVVLPEITSVQSTRPSAKKQSRAPEKAAQLPSRQSARSHVNVQELLKRSPVTAVDPRIQKLIADQLDVEQDQVVPTASLVEDLDADSLDLVEYFMNVEQLFSITISDEDAEQLMTVGGMHAYLSGRGVL